jgi:hypothetical protein
MPVGVVDGCERVVVVRKRKILLTGTKVASEATAEGAFSMRYWSYSLD